MAQEDDVNDINADGEFFRQLDAVYEQEVEAVGKEEADRLLAQWLVQKEEWLRKKWERNHRQRTTTSEENTNQSSTQGGSRRKRRKRSKRTLRNYVVRM
jgi:hypothetical protein